MRLYLDSSAIIYVVETSGVARSTVIQRVGQAFGSAGGAVLTSRLARLECRVKPLRDQNTLLLASYDSLFSHPNLLLADVSADVLDRAADLRAQFGYRTPDAIHLATALQFRATDFLTGDAALARCPGIKVEILRP